MSNSKLKKLHEIRKRKQESARRAYGEALKQLMQVERLLKMLKIRRVEFAKEIERKSHEEAQALLEKAVDINSISANNDAFERRQGALRDMDKDIERTAQHKEYCAEQAEIARIAYAEASKAEQKIAELVTREVEAEARKAERLEELSQDVTVRESRTGKWITRPST